MPWVVNYSPSSNWGPRRRARAATASRRRATTHAAPSAQPRSAAPRCASDAEAPHGFEDEGVAHAAAEPFDTAAPQRAPCVGRVRVRTQRENHLSSLFGYPSIISGPGFDNAQKFGNPAIALLHRPERVKRARTDHERRETRPVAGLGRRPIRLRLAVILLAPPTRGAPLVRGPEVPALAPPQAVGEGIGDQEPRRANHLPHTR